MFSNCIFSGFKCSNKNFQILLMKRIIINRIIFKIYLMLIMKENKIIKIYTLFIFENA